MPKASPVHAKHPKLLAVGEAVRALRKQRDVSQEALALLTQIDRTYMGAIERGDQNVGVMHLVRIAEALEISVEEIIAAAEI
jgi:transcriptional regulator with XRE-family HTH domain